MTESSVTIRGSKQHEERQERGDVYRCEIATGALARTIALPGFVGTEKTQAAFKDGILELKLPKMGKAKRRTINIK